ncbi:hypothetical protein BDW62DRAFT_143209 [Aspergillus aurantiobrunneus]
MQLPPGEGSEIARPQFLLPFLLSFLSFLFLAVSHEPAAIVIGRGGNSFNAGPTWRTDASTAGCNLRSSSREASSEISNPLHIGEIAILIGRRVPIWRRIRIQAIAQGEDAAVHHDDPATRQDQQEMSYGLRHGRRHHASWTLVLRDYLLCSVCSG